jgi:hypothetical protein
MGSRLAGKQSHGSSCASRPARSWQRVEKAIGGAGGGIVQMAKEPWPTDEHVIAIKLGKELIATCRCGWRHESENIAVHSAAVFEHLKEQPAERH